jgi:arylsulfatase A-like enzyme
MKILVFVARGLQAAYLGCYGNPWIVTPTLDCLAAEGIVFDQHYADCVDAFGVAKTWRTGRHHFPDAHPVSQDFPPASPDLVELVSRHDIPTVLLTAGVGEHLHDEFHSGWKKIVEPSSDCEPTEAFENILGRAERVFKQLASGKDWLVWIDAPTLLPPWNLPTESGDVYFGEDSEEEGDEDGDDAPEAGERATPWTGPLPEFVEPADDALFERLRRTYGGAVTFLDDSVAKLLSLLETKGLLDDLLLIVTSDRGLPLGEHGSVGERIHAPYEELIHLPLIVRLPGGAEAGRRVAALTQPVDLMPTVADALAVPHPDVHGHALLPLCRGEIATVRSYAASGVVLHGATGWALRTPDWGLIVSEMGHARDSAGVRHLYAKPADRWEVNDLVQHHPELAPYLEETLRAFVAATRQPGPLIPPELRTAQETQSS